MSIRESLINQIKPEVLISQIWLLNNYDMDEFTRLPLGWNKKRHPYSITLNNHMLCAIGQDERSREPQQNIKTYLCIYINHLSPTHTGQ